MELVPVWQKLNPAYCRSMSRKKGSILSVEGGSVGIRVDARSFKMSKSRGNVVNPDDVVKEYGADSLRMFEMFMGPLEQVKPWSTAGVEGVYRFLQRVWRNLFDSEEPDSNDGPKSCWKRHPERGTMNEVNSPQSSAGGNGVASADQEGGGGY